MTPTEALALAERVAAQACFEKIPWPDAAALARYVIEQGERERRLVEAGDIIAKHIGRKRDFDDTCEDRDINEEIAAWDAAKGGRDEPQQAG